MFKRKFSQCFVKISKWKSARKSDFSEYNGGNKMSARLASSGPFESGQIINNHYFHNKSLSSINNAIWTIHQCNLSKLTDVKCWNCGQFLEQKKLACSNCGSLQQPKQNINFFELFGISQTYNMDLEALSNKFKDMQMTFHPDKFANKSKMELEISENYSRLVNKAYTTLKDPLKRGMYLLELKQLTLEENFNVGQDFLTVIMEKNEELDGIQSQNVLEKFERANREDIEKEIKLIAESFNYNKWVDAKNHLLKLNYYINLEKKIKGKQMDMSGTEIK